MTSIENSPNLWISDYPWPKPQGHKYSRGHVLVLGGAVMTGASRLTARGALRIGAGVVTLAVPEHAWPVYASSFTSAIVRPCSDVSDFLALLSDGRKNVVALGPGAGANEYTRQCVLAALGTQRAIVLDADALTVFADAPDALFCAINGPCILTPHEGEFARLFGFEGDRLFRATQAARVSNAIIVLKGPATIIAAPDGRTIINNNAPPQLATGGSGDVLTGFIAGLVAQGMDGFHAAAAAVWLHGEAARAFGIGLIAEDLPETIPSVLQKLSDSRII